MHIGYLLLAIAIFIIAAVILGALGTGSDGRRARPRRTFTGNPLWPKDPDE
jgi:hypothetical protein